MVVPSRNFFEYGCVKDFDQLQLSSPFYFKAFQLGWRTVIVEDSVLLRQQLIFFFRRLEDHDLEEERVLTVHPPLSGLRIDKVVVLIICESSMGEMVWDLHIQMT